MAIFKDNELSELFSTIAGSDWIVEGLLQADDKDLQRADSLAQSHLENVLHAQQRIGDILLDLRRR